jgi:predicted ATP-dependent endonuclease of OLD family
MAEYIQIVEFQTSNLDEVRRLARERGYEDGTPKPLSVTVVADRDRTGTYATILRFSSYDEAMQHSEAPSTQELMAKLGPLMTGERRFYNLDVVEDTRF